MKENYIAKIDNVECVVAFVNAPKDEKRGYSYTLNIKNPPKELTPYLSGKYNSIYMYTYDQAPRFSSKQTITIARLGITEWSGSDGTKKYSAHAIIPEKEQKFQGTKELPIIQTETVSTEKAIPPQKLEDKVDWDGKELRTFRSKVLAQVSSSLKQKDTEEDLEWADRVIMTAELRFLHYIYNGYIKPTRPNLKEDAPF